MLLQLIQILFIMSSELYRLKILGLAFNFRHTIVYSILGSEKHLISVHSSYR